MTKFEKDQFTYDSGYLSYGPQRNFIARFKYKAGQRGSFITFLIKNFTTEEYFEAMADGKPPLAILTAKGYLQPYIKKWLKANGYEVSTKGYEKYLADQVARINTRLNLNVNGR